MKADTPLRRPGSGRKIHKWAVPTEAFDSDRGAGSFALELPQGAQVLGFGEDTDRVLCLWASVPVTPQVMHTRRFQLVFTGQPFRIEPALVGPDACYHGRAIHQGLIWHLLEHDPPVYGFADGGCGQVLR